MLWWGLKNKTEIIYFLPAVAGGSLKDLQANLDRFVHSNQFKSLVSAITLKAIILIIILMLIITITGQGHHLESDFQEKVLPGSRSYNWRDSPAKGSSTWPHGYCEVCWSTWLLWGLFVSVRPFSSKRSWLPSSNYRYLDFIFCLPWQNYKNTVKEICWSKPSRTNAEYCQ